MQKKKKLKMRFHAQFRLIRKYSILILFCCVLLMGVTYLYKEFKDLLKSTAPRGSKYLRLPKVVVHFDLKGAPPDMRHLRSILRHIKDLGATAILLEYEDMFPYDEEIRNLSSPFHYNRADLVAFLQRATKLNLEVIPLIQTFGHMEYALKLEEFKNLREHPSYPDSLCPSKNKSLELLRSMIGQVVFLHKSVTPLQSIHIGCDEVYRHNYCPDCTKRGLPKSTLFIQHLRTVAKMVRHLVPDIKILIWDDMLRTTNISFNFEKELELLSSEYQIQPVVWDYTAELSTLSHKHMHLYQKTFKNMWAASAYKGASDPESVAPNFRERLLNNLNWLKFIEKYTGLYNFNGIILTGWSRFSHFQPICDLLPVSYQIISTCLMLISNFKYVVRTDADTRIERFSIKDWELASEIYFDDIFKSVELCAMNIAIRFRPECGLNTEETSALNDRVIAYDNAIKKHRDTFVYFDLAARIEFGYTDQQAIANFVMNSYYLKENIKRRGKLLKKTMRLFFGENVYNEYISYKSFSVFERQDLAESMIKKLNKKGAKGMPSPSHKVVWSRGRNYTVFN